MVKTVIAEMTELLESLEKKRQADLTPIMKNFIFLPIQRYYSFEGLGMMSS